MTSSKVCAKALSVYQIHHVRRFFTKLDRLHRYPVVARFTKTLQKRNIYRNIHGNCADNPVYWTTYNIELFIRFKGLNGPIKRNLNFRATFASRCERRWKNNIFFRGERLLQVGDPLCNFFQNGAYKKQST